MDLNYYGWRTQKFFDNGFGASIIVDGYGRERNLFEVCMLKVTEKDSDGNVTKWDLVYPAGTSFETDVVGWCDFEDVVRLLKEIENYKEDENSKINYKSDNE